MSNYANAFTEVYTILSFLSEEEYNKIPKKVHEAIAINRNKEYEYKMNDSIDLTKQDMLRETKAILFNLYRDYLCTPEQKDKIIKIQQEERRKNELKKKELYNIEVFEPSNKAIQLENKETAELVQYRENIFRKILNKIKRIFKK